MSSESPQDDTPESGHALSVADQTATGSPQDNEDSEAGTPAVVRFKDLMDRVALSTGAKKKDVREIVEATLSELGVALKNGEMLMLPELGRVRVAKAKTEEAGSVMTLKVRPFGKGMGKNATQAALAEPMDQS